MQALDLGAHFHAQFGVQVGQRLVKQKELRLTGQRPSHGHALTLPARQLRGPAVQQMADLQRGRHLLHARLALGLGHLAHLQRKADVFRHAHGRVQRVALKHHRNIALRRRHAHHIATTDPYLAFGGFIKSGNDVEQSGLAAARGADQNQELTGGDIDVDALEHLHHLVALAKSLADARDVQRSCHGVHPFTAPAVSPFTKY